MPRAPHCAATHSRRARWRHPAGGASRARAGSRSQDLTVVVGNESEASEPGLVPEAEFSVLRIVWREFYGRLPQRWTNTEMRPTATVIQPSNLRPAPTE